MLTAERGGPARRADRSGREVLRDLLRALRLFGDGRVDPWRARVGADRRGAWNALALGPGGAPHGMLVVTAEQEDELRAFCNLVSRRAPDGNELVWALRALRLGCERESALEAPSDHLLALRVLLEPEGPSSGAAGRPAGGALRHARAQGLELTEWTSCDRARARRIAASPPGAATRCRREIAREIADHLRALLRDVSAATSSPRPGRTSRSAAARGRRRPASAAPVGHRSAGCRAVGCREPAPSKRRHSNSCSAIRARPRRSWTSSSRCPTTIGWRPPQPRRRARDRVTVAAREHVEIGEVGGHTACRRRPAPRRSPRDRSATARSVRRMCTRLTISSPTDIPARQALGQVSRLPSRLGLGRGDDQEAVWGASSSASTPSVRSRKPSMTPDSERKKRGSRQHVNAGDAGEDREHERGSAPEHAGRSPPGARNTCRARPSRKPSMRPGASRKSSALRDGGVRGRSRRSRVPRGAHRASRPRSARASPTPRTRTRRRRGWRGSPPALLVRLKARDIPSNVRLTSSLIAHSPPPSRRPAPRIAPTRSAAAPRSSRKPSADARRGPGRS